CQEGRSVALHPVTARRARWTAAAAACVVATAACGKKGPPQAPLRPIPGVVAAWSIERDGGAIRLRVTVPDANTDGSKPPAVDRVEIYSLTKPAGDPAPPPADLVVPANLIGTIAVRAADAAPPKPGAPADLRPAPGGGA